MDKLPFNSDLLRPLHSNEVLKEGDYWLLNGSWRVLKKCRYDPGCCTERKAGYDSQYARLKGKRCKTPK